VSLRLILTFILFVLLTTYFTFLNPGNIDVRMTQDRTLQVPVVVFLLASVLVGALLTSVFTGFSHIRETFKSFLKTRSQENRTRRQQRWENLFQKAEIAVEGGHREKGLSLLKKILKSNPHHIPSLIHLGNLYRNNGKTLKAIETHQQAVDQDRNNPRALQYLAEDFAAAGQTEQAIETLKQARHLEPESLLILRKLRQAYRNQGDWNLVLQIQKSILSHVSDARDLEREKEYSGQIAYFRGCELLHQQMIESAISEFQRAIKVNPLALPPYIKLGDLYKKADNLKAAIKIWKSGFQQTGSHICLLRLRETYEQSDKPGEVIKLYQEAVRASRNSEKETLSLVLAEMYIDQGQMEEAMQTLWSIANPSIPAHLLLIKAHQDQNQEDKADQVIRAALKKVTSSLSRFVCRQCHKEFEQWSGECPNCDAWDSLDTALHQTL